MGLEGQALSAASSSIIEIELGRGEIKTGGFRRKSLEHTVKLRHIPSAVPNSLHFSSSRRREAQQNAFPHQPKLTILADAIFY